MLRGADVRKVRIRSFMQIIICMKDYYINLERELMLGGKSEFEYKTLSIIEYLT